MKIQNPMSIYEKLNILSDAAKYDVACTSSGTKRKGDGSGMGNCTQCGICHSFSTDGRCISLLKILFTNECIFDCKYCVNRRSNDVVEDFFLHLMKFVRLQWNSIGEIILKDYF